MKYARIDAITNQVLLTQEFIESETPPTDIPHKGIVWRPIEEVHEPYDAETHMEVFDGYELTPDKYLKKYKAVPLPEVPDEVRQPASLRDIQSKFFTSEHLALTMLIYDLYNEVRELKGEPAVDMDTFKEILRNYA